MVITEVRPGKTFGTERNSELPPRGLWVSICVYVIDKTKYEFFKERRIIFHTILIFTIQFYENDTAPLRRNEFLKAPSYITDNCSRYRGTLSSCIFRSILFFSSSKVMLELTKHVLLLKFELAVD